MRSERRLRNAVKHLAPHLEGTLHQRAVQVVRAMDVGADKLEALVALGAIDDAVAMRRAMKTPDEGA